jgi:hypothetical protein
MAGDPPSKPEVPSWFRLGADQLTAIAAVAASGVFLVYLVGGLVYWVRFRDAGLPSTFGLSLIDPRSLLVVGLAELIAPVILSIVLSAVLLLFLDKRFGPPEPIEPISVSPRVLRRLRLAFRTIYALFLGFGLLIAPLGWSGLSMLLYFINGWVIAGTVTASRPHNGGRIPPHIWRYIGVLFITLPLSTFFGQLDGPSQLNRATVTTNTGVTRDVYYVAATTDYVYLGENDNIVAVPISSVQRMVIRQAPPLNHPGSLLDRITG